MMSDAWVSLVQEYEHLIGTDWKDARDDVWRFYGLVYAEDDYYYGMIRRDGKTLLLSCVGSLETFMERVVNPRFAGQTRPTVRRPRQSES